MLYTVWMASWSVAQSGHTVTAGKSSSDSGTLSMLLVAGLVYKNISHLNLY